MKNYQMFEIKENWNKLKSLSGNKGYYLPLVKNIKLIDIEIEGLELIRQKTKEFEEFLKEKDILVKKYAKPDSEGNPSKTVEIVDGKQYYKYDIDETKKEEFDAEGAKLVDQFQTTLQEMRDKELTYMSTLDADCTIPFNKIKECDLPSEMTPELIEMIYDFLELE